MRTLKSSKKQDKFTNKIAKLESEEAGRIFFELFGSEFIFPMQVVMNNNIFFATFVAKKPNPDFLGFEDAGSLVVDSLRQGTTRILAKTGVFSTIVRILTIQCLTAGNFGEPGELTYLKIRAVVNAKKGEREHDFVVGLDADDYDIRVNATIAYEIDYGSFKKAYINEF